MSELASIVGGLASETLSDLPDARLEQDFDELTSAIDQLQAQRLRRLRELERRRVFEREGHRSPVAWLSDRYRVGWGSASRDMALARDLKAMALVDRGLQEGTLSLDRARALARVRTVDPHAFSASEPLLVAAARDQDAQGFSRALSHWRVMAEAGAGPERLRERRGLHASATLGGMVRVDGNLDPENGEALLTALGAVMDTWARSGPENEDQRTAPQRRADALGELARIWLDRTDRPKVGGERPHISVTVDLETLRASRDGNGVAVLDHSGPVATELARLLACDASVRRVVLGGGSVPLDVGRTTPVVPSGMRRALIVRDGGCAVPGCGRPHPWCDAHHVTHWARGGETSLANLVLVCRPHHRLIHAGKVGVRMQGSRPVFEDAGPGVAGTAGSGSGSEGRAPP